MRGRWIVGTCFSLVTFCLQLSLDASRAEEGQLHIGWAAQNIAPDRPVALAGQRHLRIAQKVADPITCTALAIETRNGKDSLDHAILLSCDLVAIRGGIQEQLRTRLAERLPEVEPHKVFLHATHTHTAPVTSDGDYDIPSDVMQPTEYAEYFVAKAEQAVVQAWSTRKPAAMSWGLGQAVIGYNRRAVYADGRSTMYGDTSRESFRVIEGPSDHGVELLFFWAEKNGPSSPAVTASQKALTGIVVNIACPSQETEGRSEISADFWHELRTEIRRRYGEHLQVLPQCAAAGDQSPHLLFRKRAEDLMLHRKGVSRRQEIANRLADAIDQVLPYAQQETKTHLEFTHLVDNVSLPRRMATENEAERAKAKLQELNARAPGKSWEKSQQLEIIDSFENPAANREHGVEVHVLRLGDIAMASNPFEYYLDFGIRIKSRSNAVLTFLIQLAGPGTYVPTDRAILGGGYSAEISSNLIGAEGGQLLVDETVDRINSLFLGQ